MGRAGVAEEAGDKRTLQFRRGKDDSMYRRNAHEVREATTTAAEAATGNPRGPGPVASVAERLVVASKPGNAGGAKGPRFGHVAGRDKGIAIGSGLATKENPSVPETTVWSGEGSAPQSVIGGLTVKPVGEADAGNPRVRFDEREVETEHGMGLLRHRRGNPETEYVEA